MSLVKKDEIGLVACGRNAATFRYERGDNTTYANRSN